MRTQKAAASVRIKKRAPATKKAPVLTLLPKLPLSVTQVINTYSPPTKSLAHKHWGEIAQIVRTHLLAQNIQGPENALKYIRTLSRHAAARHSLTHAITKAEDLFSDAALSTTYGVSLSSSNASGTKVNDLIFLRRMRANLLPELYGKTKELVYPRSTIAEPYTVVEITQMLSFARQRTSLLCIHQHGAILLSISAGLTHAELMNARGSDLISSPWGLLIKTDGLSSGGNRSARQVPILATYEDELSALALTIGGGLFLGQSAAKETRNPSALKSRASKVPHFKTNRGRNTWLKEILRSGAPFIALRQAGVPMATNKHLAVLSKGMKLTQKEYISTMRGPGASFDQSKHPHLVQYLKEQ